VGALILLRHLQVVTLRPCRRLPPSALGLPRHPAEPGVEVRRLCRRMLAGDSYKREAGLPRMCTRSVGGGGGAPGRRRSHRLASRGGAERARDDVLVLHRCRRAGERH
jgi:hypothetical protein